MTEERLDRLADLYDDVHDERVRAHHKHLSAGNSMEDQPPTDSRWLPVLVEEVGEAAKAINDRVSLQHLREELVQVAAMACAWIAAIDEEEPFAPDSP